MIQIELAEYLKSLQAKPARSVKTLPSVFAEYMPANVVTGSFIKLAPEGVAIDGEIEGFHTGEVQLLTRAKTAQEAERLALDGMSALTFKTETLLGERYLVKQMRPTAVPRSYPLTPGEQYECAVTFRIAYVTLQ